MFPSKKKQTGFSFYQKQDSSKKSKLLKGGLIIAILGAIGAAISREKS